MKIEHQWKITIGSQEELVIPKSLASLAQFTDGEALEVTAQEGELFITKKPPLRRLVDQFIEETRKELGHLKPTDAWNDQMTVGQYLALSEAERDQLWEAAFAQAHSEQENAEELDADADYIPQSPTEQMTRSSSHERR
jgi:antitoxin component of MazEF toxin-antitoxin module